MLLLSPRHNLGEQLGGISEKDTLMERSASRRLMNSRLQGGVNKFEAKHISIYLRAAVPSISLSKGYSTVRRDCLLFIDLSPKIRV